MGKKRQSKEWEEKEEEEEVQEGKQEEEQAMVNRRIEYGRGVSFPFPFFPPFHHSFSISPHIFLHTHTLLFPFISFLASLSPSFLHYHYSLSSTNFREFLVLVLSGWVWRSCGGGQSVNMPPDPAHTLPYCPCLPRLASPRLPFPLWMLPLLAYC